MLRKIPLIQLPRRYVWLWEKWRTAVCEKDFEQSRAFYPFNAEHRLCDLYGLPAQLFGKIMDEIFMEINVPTHYSNWMLKNSRPFHIVKIENMIFLDFSWGNSSSDYAQFIFIHIQFFTTHSKYLVWTESWLRHTSLFFIT